AAEALGRSAPEAAVSYLRRALREPPPKGDRHTVSRELGVALLRADDPEGIEVLRAVRGAVDDPVVRAEIATELSISLAFRPSGGKGAALVEESLAEIGDDHKGLGLFLRGHLLVQLISGMERIPDGLHPEPEAWPDGASREGRFVLRQLAFLYAIGFGRLDQALELAERSTTDLALYESDVLAGLPAHHVFGAQTLADRGDLTPEYFAAGLEAAKRRGTMASVAAAHGVRASCRFADGDLRGAQVDAEAAVRFEPPDLRVQLTGWLAASLKILLAQGDSTAAQELLDRVWRGREPGPGIPGAFLLTARGELRQASGRHAEARHDFLAAAERVRWLPYPNPEVLGWRTGLALAEDALGNHEEARRLTAEAVRLARMAGGSRGIGFTLHVQGLVSEGSERIDLLHEASEILAGTRARLYHAEALADLGAALRRANRRKEAREPLREALDLAHRCGAVPLEERARTELEVTGARPRKALLSGVESLTPSELRVARLAAAGKTNREIAHSLVVTQKTVETHMRHVFQKLDVDRRTALAPVLAEDLPAV
ncbi:MAG: LuxR C-terminal-related transcriptional regulator, partial [Solirubrobacterales bacterium]